MSFDETSRTIASGRQVVVNGAEAVTGFPLSATDGSLTAPSYSFASDTDTGMHITSSGDMTTGVDGIANWSVSSNSNVSLLGPPPSNYGITTPGSGVVYLNDASTNPTSGPNGGSGGLIFVDGLELKYTDSGGTQVSLTGLTGDLNGPGSSTDNNVARFNGTTGKVIEDSGSFLLNSSSILLTQANTPGAPAYSFVSNKTTGMYSPGPNEVSFSVGGVRRLHVPLSGATSDGVVALSTGSLSNPSLTFASGGGMFLSGSSTVSFVGGGEIGMSVSPNSNISFAGSPPSNFGTVTEGRGVVFINEVISPPTSLVSGGVSLWVNGNSLMMMRNTSATPVDLTACIEGPLSATDNAVVRFDGTSGDLVKSTNVVSVNDTGEVRAPGGSASLPTYSFAGETITGMYSDGGDTLNFSLLTNLTMTIDTTQILSSSRVLTPSGTKIAPGMSRVGDTDTGFYLQGGTSFAATCGNSTCFVVSPNANVSLAGDEASSYGGGQGVIFLNQASLNPGGTVVSHGILYISSASVNDLVFHDASGVTTTLTNRISGPASTTDRSVVRWDGTTGKIIQTTSNITISASDELLSADGSSGAPTYSFVGDTDTGLSLPGANTLSMILGGSSVLDVSSSAVDVLQVMDVPVGAVGTPSLSFASDPDNGVYHPAADTIAIVGGGSAGMTIVLESGATAPNITLGSGVTDYGGTTEGERVVLIDDVSVAPSGSATSGGRLYVTGTTLRYHDDGGGDVNLFNMVNTIGSNINGSLARYNGTSGQIQESGFIINDPSAIDYPVTGSAASPTFSFTSDSTSGMYWSSSSSIGLVTGGVDRLTLTSTAVSAPSQAIQADVSLRVGGSTGVETSLSTANIIENVKTPSTGTFAWSNDTGSIMNTTSSRNLALSNKLLFTNTTNVLSIGHDGTDFACDYLATAGGYMHINVAGVDMMELRNNEVTLETAGTTLTITNRCLMRTGNTSAFFDYSVWNTNRGMMKREVAESNILIGLGSTRVLHFMQNHNAGWGLEVTGGMTGGIFFANASTVASGTLGATDLTLYMELSSGLFGFGGYTGSARTILDGSRERATITLSSLSVSNATSTNTDGQTWTSSDDYGVNGTTTGEMTTSDDCIVCFTATAEWASNSTGYRRLSITRKTAGPTYTVLNSVTTMAVNGDVTAQTVRFFGAIDASADELTVQVYQDSTVSLNVDLSASFVRYDTDEPV
jgi:hypothetical protein